MSLAPCRKELPLLHCSYRLMGQTKILTTASVIPILTCLCRLLPVPAGRWPFPTLSLQSLHSCLDPCPAASFRCIYPFLPGKHRPRLRGKRLGTPNILCNATSTEDLISRLQSFRYVQAPILARPPGCTHCITSVMSGQAVYTTHSSVRYLPRDVVSLRIRHG